MKGSQFEKRLTNSSSQILSNASIASNSRKQRQSDIGSIAKQLNMEDPIHEDGEDVMPEQGVPTFDKYPNLICKTAHECVSAFDEDEGKLQDQPS